MKLVKTANGKNKIRMTRKEWTSMGKKAGWADELDYGSRPGAEEATKTFRILKSALNNLNNFHSDRLEPQAMKRTYKDLGDSLKELSKSQSLREDSRTAYEKLSIVLGKYNETDAQKLWWQEWWQENFYDKGKSLLERDINDLRNQVQPESTTKWEQGEESLGARDWSDVQ